MNVGRWMPQGGAEGEEFKMLQKTQRTTVDIVDLQWMKQVDHGGPWTFGLMMFVFFLFGATLQAIASSFRRTRTGDAVPGLVHA